jgi:hypothetical protein
MDELIKVFANAGVNKNICHKNEQGYGRKRETVQTIVNDHRHTEKGSPTLHGEKSGKAHQPQGKGYRHAHQQAK